MNGLEKTLEILRRSLEEMRRERETLDAAIACVEHAVRICEGREEGMTVAFRRAPVWSPDARRGAKQRAAARWAIVKKAGGRTLADLPEARRVLSDKSARR